MIRPGRGVLSPGQTVTVQVGVNVLFEGRYRMQVAYCETEGSAQDDFNVLWKGLNKEDITDEFLTLDCERQSVGIRATESPVISGAEERECAKSQSSSMSIDPLKLEPLKKSNTVGHHNSNTMFQTVTEEVGMLHSIAAPLRCDSGTVLKELAREKETNHDLVLPPPLSVRSCARRTSKCSRCVPAWCRGRSTVR